VTAVDADPNPDTPERCVEFDPLLTTGQVMLFFLRG
jgi:hypothetical protein